MNSRSVHPAWRLAEPWPAILVAPHVVDEPPDLEDFLAALASRLGATVEVMEFLPSADEKHPWSVLVRLPEQLTPVLISCERTKRMDEVPPGLADSVARSKFTIVVESLLDGEDPRMIWGRLAMVAAWRPEAIAMLDGATGRWFDRAEIDRDLSDLEFGPPEDVLWRVQAVSSSENLTEGTVWLFTRGLLRCGLPELEMLEVPGRDAAAASKLIDALAGLLLEDGPPAPEIPYPLGPGIDVALIPWRDDRRDARFLRASAARPTERPSRRRRRIPCRLGRAAICDIEPKGSFKRRLDLAAERRGALRPAGRGGLPKRRLDVTGIRGRSPELGGRPSRRIESAAPDARPPRRCIPLGADSQGRVEHAWLQVEQAPPRAAGAVASCGPRSMGEPPERPSMFESADLDGWRLVRGEHAIGPEDAIDPLGFVERMPRRGVRDDTRRSPGDVIESWRTIRSGGRRSWSPGRRHRTEMDAIRMILADEGVPFAWSSEITRRRRPTGPCRSRRPQAMRRVGSWRIGPPWPRTSTGIPSMSGAPPADVQIDSGRSMAANAPLQHRRPGGGNRGGPHHAGPGPRGGTGRRANLTASDRRRAVAATRRRPISNRIPVMRTNPLFPCFSGSGLSAVRRRLMTLAALLLVERPRWLWWLRPEPERPWSGPYNSIELVDKDDPRLDDRGTPGVRVEAVRDPGHARTKDRRHREAVGATVTFASPSANSAPAFLDEEWELNANMAGASYAANLFRLPFDPDSVRLLVVVEPGSGRSGSSLNNEAQRELDTFDIRLPKDSAIYR